jgi:hypothetical protein
MAFSSAHARENARQTFASVTKTTETVLRRVIIIAHAVRIMIKESRVIMME